MSFQALVASVADMWDSVRPLPPPRARERIQTALVRLRARELEAEGLAVEVLDVRRGIWLVWTCWLPLWVVWVCGWGTTHSSIAMSLTCPWSMRAEQPGQVEGDAVQLQPGGLGASCGLGH